MNLVLSIDGGGQRGVIPAVVMRRLDTMVPGWRREIVLRVGTSAGGLNVLAEAAGLSPFDMVAVYEQRGRAIFKRSIWDKLKDTFGVTAAMYDIAPLEETVRLLFGEKTFAEVPPVAVTAFDLDAETNQGRMWKPKVFHNVPGPDVADLSVPLWKAALYTSAAPVFFPDVDGFVDGGVWAGNPSREAIGLMLDRRYAKPYSLGEFRLLSLGTGRVPYWMAGGSDRGVVDYGADLIRMPLAASEAAAHYLCEQLLGPHGGSWYYRWQGVLPEPWDMDDADLTGEMVTWAWSVDLDPLARWLERS